MSAMALAERYFTEVARESLLDAFPTLMSRMAIGLIGHGSQCLGYDDEISVDHDWGPAFAVFMEDADAMDHGRAVQDLLLTLPPRFKGASVLWDQRRPRERNGVLAMDSWLREQLGQPASDVSRFDWLRCDDPRLLWVTNGRIWHDPSGRLSAIRARLGAYPESVWMRKLANRCLLVQIHGPYQVHRAQLREDDLLPRLTASLFVREAIRLCFLLNRRYAPIAKWLMRGFDGLADPCGLTRDDLRGVLHAPNGSALLSAVGSMAGILHRAVMRHVPVVNGTANLLEAHFAILETIPDPMVRDAPFWDQEIVI